MASDNFTVGPIADMVQNADEEKLGKKIRIEIKNIKDYRNYKVTCQRARTTLGFLPKHSIADIVKNLYENLDSLKKSKMKENIAAHRDDAFMSRELIDLKEDLDIPLDTSSLQDHGTDCSTTRRDVR